MHMWWPQGCGKLRGDVVDVGGRTRDRTEEFSVGCDQMWRRGELKQ